ncbi:unnamed protein product, partial [Ectocarpus sp. 12 AP-2014]
RRDALRLSSLFHTSATEWARFRRSADLATPIAIRPLLGRARLTSTDFGLRRREVSPHNKREVEGGGGEERCPGACVHNVVRLSVTTKNVPRILDNFLLRIITCFRSSTQLQKDIYVFF